MAGYTLYDQAGVTEDMVEEFGERIFRMSHNIQTRMGDPYRLKDWDQVDAQRESMGLTDGEIAGKLDLEVEQVTFIRTLFESRRFRTGHYKRLYKLGGGKRYRPEREEGDG